MNNLVCFAVENSFFNRELALTMLDEEFRTLLATATMLDALVEGGFFPSKGQARKNWKESIIIPDGYNEWVVGKYKRKLAIWCPVETIEEKLIILPCEK